jgi:putative Holliday junction resolvase
LPPGLYFQVIELKGKDIGRIIAIDLGLKRTGLAVTDLQRIIASPLAVVETENLIVFLEDYFSKEPVDGLVLGEPRDLRGRDTHMSAKVREVSGLLQKKFPQIRVYHVDERFTSKIAQDAMIRGGMKKKDRRKKGNVDLISATLILQSFLERQSR